VTFEKGPLDLVDILAGVARGDTVMDVIGPADARITTAVTGRVQSRGVEGRFHLAGPVPNETLPVRLAGAVAFVFPSTHPEGLSKAVMEAMAAGLPVIAYDIPGMRVLVEDGVTGWVVPAGDTAAAAACVDRLLADPALGAAMGAAARKRLARDFGQEAVASQWDALLRDVVDEGVGG
jgi:glycosyltransferase involved in cell wall biosynthesis